MLIYVLIPGFVDGHESQLFTFSCFVILPCWSENRVGKCGGGGGVGEGAATQAAKTALRYSPGSTSRSLSHCPHLLM